MESTTTFQSFRDLMQITKDPALKKAGRLKLSREYTEEEWNRLEGKDEEGRPVMTREELQQMNEEQGMDAAIREHGNDPHKRMDLCGFPKRRIYREQFKNINFRDDYPEAFVALNNRNWLYVYGKKGTGKTSFACHLGWEYLKKHPTRKATFLSIKDWMASLMPNQSNTKPVDVPDLNPFVILDDIDKFQMEKDWQGLNIFRLLDHLYREADRYHVVITSNRHLGNLRQTATGDRLEPAIDRIYEMSYPVFMKGDSKRTPPQP